MSISENYLQDVHKVPAARSNTFVWRNSDTSCFLCLKVGVSSALLDYSCNGDPLSCVYCPADPSLGKNPSVVNTAFRDTAKLLSKPWDILMVLKENI